MEGNLTLFTPNTQVGAINHIGIATADLRASLKQFRELYGSPDAELLRNEEAGLLAATPRRFADAPLQFCGDWNAPLLAWRLANPATRYRTARRGDLTAVYADTHLSGVRCAAFVDGGTLAATDAPPLGFTLFLGLDPRFSLDGPRFLRLPDRFRPSPLNLIYRPLSEAAPRSLDPQATAISFLDFDPY